VHVVVAHLIIFRSSSSPRRLPETWLAILASSRDSKARQSVTRAELFARDLSQRGILCRPKSRFMHLLEACSTDAQGGHTVCEQGSRNRLGSRGASSLGLGQRMHSGAADLWRKYLHALRAKPLSLEQLWQLFLDHPWYQCDLNVCARLWLRRR